MKIVIVSNFSDESFNEYFVAHDLSPHNADSMCIRLNAHPDAAFDPGFYRAVSDDYKLRVFKT